MKKCGLPDDAAICQAISNGEDCSPDCPHSIPGNGFSCDGWENAQKLERDWWIETSPGSHFEERKQMLMAEKMGVSHDPNFRIDLGGKSVLDVGGGPVSLLLKCTNGRRVVLDPLKFPEWVNHRYEAAGIEVKHLAAEEMEESGYDEVWIYNVLQHVRDPKRVLENAMVAGRTLRIFEWIDTGTDEMHLHSITRSSIEDVIGRKGNAEFITNVDGLPAKAFWGSFPTTRMRRTSSGRESLTFHIPAIPHTVTNKDYISCAYTQKCLKLSKMLTDLGHTVYHYGCEGSEVDCTESIDVVSDEYRRAFYPHSDDMTRQFTFDINDDYHGIFRKRTAEEIEKRLGEKNFLLCAWGVGHKGIADILGDKVKAVESGIGYADTFARYRVFESYAWMHWVYGKNQQSDGGWYDAVIPNFFDPDDFEFREEKEDWILYIGRIVKRKGVELASQLAERTGHKLVIAGQGTLKNDGEKIDIKGDHIDFVGHADVEKRKDLMSRAKAVIVPTYYIGPFEGVAVEAMLSGTPVISSDWGAFSEHNLHGVTGYRCRTMEHFEWALNNIENISPLACREWAIDNYSMGRVSLMYDEYFSMISDLWGKGWYEKREDREEMDWLKKFTPTP